jgi:hypothetical protein
MNADQLDIKQIGPEKYTLEFPYNPDFIEFIKYKVPSSAREYDPDTKVWTVRGKEFLNHLQGVGLQKFAHVMFIYRKDADLIFRNVRTGTENVQRSLFA